MNVVGDDIVDADVFIELFVREESSGDGVVPWFFVCIDECTFEYLFTNKANESSFSLTCIKGIGHPDG